MLSRTDFWTIYLGQMQLPATFERLGFKVQVMEDIRKAEAKRQRLKLEIMNYWTSINKKK